jgi:hypothetical protein
MASKYARQRSGKDRRTGPKRVKERRQRRAPVKVERRAGKERRAGERRSGTDRRNG